MKIVAKIYSIVKVHNFIDLPMETLDCSMCVLIELLEHYKSNQINSVIQSRHTVVCRAAQEAGA